MRGVPAKRAQTASGRPSPTREGGQPSALAMTGMLSKGRMEPVGQIARFFLGAIGRDRRLGVRGFGSEFAARMGTRSLDGQQLFAGRSEGPCIGGG